MPFGHNSVRRGIFLFAVWAQLIARLEWKFCRIVLEGQWTMYIILVVQPAFKWNFDSDSGTVFWVYCHTFATCPLEKKICTLLMSWTVTRRELWVLYAADDIINVIIFLLMCAYLFEACNISVGRGEDFLRRQNYMPSIRPWASSWDDHSLLHVW